MRHFSAPELAGYLEDNQPLLLDVREPWEFEKCHIQGSQLVPMQQVPGILEQLQTEQEIVVICHHGIRSRSVCNFLEQNGYSNTINLSGGVDAWAKQVDPSMVIYQ